MGGSKANPQEAAPKIVLEYDAYNNYDTIGEVKSFTRQEIVRDEDRGDKLYHKDSHYIGRNEPRYGSDG
jgi:hypothetical protein